MAEFHGTFNCLKLSQATSSSYQFTGKPLPNGSLKDDLKEFLALVPADKVLEIALDYLANDKELREFVVYIQSEEFPTIHSFVERLKEYKDVSAFMCMFLMLQLDRENICSVSTGV